MRRFSGGCFPRWSLYSSSLTAWSSSSPWSSAWSGGSESTISFQRPPDSTCSSPVANGRRRDASRCDVITTAAAASRAINWLFSTKDLHQHFNSTAGWCHVVEWRKDVEASFIQAVTTCCRTLRFMTACANDCHSLAANLLTCYKSLLNSTFVRKVLFIVCRDMKLIQTLTDCNGYV